jgi:UDP-N-acetylglucosamine 2-epimerase (non-hydrolysing)
MKRLLFVFGTRPEAIKLAPAVAACSRNFDVRVCVTAQHRDMLDQVLRIFSITPDYDLDLMQPNQTLFDTTARIVSGLRPVLEEVRPDFAVVQGDTTTTFAGALAAFYAGVPVAHVEAGLRTGDMCEPFPEEMNRVLTTRLSAIHFAPTERARRNLLDEGIADDSIYVTGNTGIDAVLHTCAALDSGAVTAPVWQWPDDSRRLLLVTAHRRESFGAGIEAICEAIRRLAARGDVQVVFPVHPNPQVREPVHRLLGGIDGVTLLEPLNYVAFADLMRRASILITDSGGVQEEGPSLGKPVLVMRDKTERPEALEAGTAVLTGCNPEQIVQEAARLLDDKYEYEFRTKIRNPYGDGRAAHRIAEILTRRVSGN